MNDPEAALGALVQQALADELGAEYAAADPLIRPSGFADFQSNVAMSLSKRLGRAPRDVAAPVADRLTAAPAVAKAEVSGPGFINITLADEWIAEQSSAQLADLRLGVAPAEPSQRIVVDYSGPNVAKELHAGHLRATVVGDAIVRVLEYLGHEVIRAAHLGDWGTPFGQLIEHAIDIGDQATYDQLASGEFTAFYQAARAKFDSDPAFADRSRKRVVQLQAGEPETMRLWQMLVDDSMEYLRKIYARLNITLTDADMDPESFYNPMLADVSDELESRGIAVISDGALCAFPPGFTGRDGNPVPLMLRKSDGGYGYDSTDAAAIRYRLTQLGATRIIYVVGSEQSQHLQMIFELARQAGWLVPPATAEHAVIGLMTGPGGQRLRTRSGEQVKLADLIDEAVDRAAMVIADRYDDPAQRSQIAEAVGIGALKYGDLSVARDSSYALDFDRLLALTGNTGPYLQYATARIR
jgi:arginyl-tRNA synthetase